MLLQDGGADSERALAAAKAVLLQDGADFGSPEKLAAYVTDLEMTFGAPDFPSLELSDGPTIGYTYKPLGATFVALRAEGDFETIITELALQAGDADTCVSVTHFATDATRSGTAWWLGHCWGARTGFTLCRRR